MRLDDLELERYARQISLPEIGIEGQITLKNASVLCVGAGGLGAPLLQYLAAAGVGTIGIIDADTVELSNLPRQIIYTYEDIGVKKVVAAQRYLQRLNPRLRCNIYPEQFSLTNARKLISDYDVIADCTDSLANRYLTNDICFALHKPFVFAGISGFQAQFSLFNGKQGPCFRCLFSENDSAGTLPDCNLGGVLGVLAGLLGTLQASMILMTLLQLDAALQARFHQFDLLTMKLNEYRVQANPSCPVCSTLTFSAGLQPAYRAINGNDLKQMQASGVHYHLIDVRSVAEHRNFNIGGLVIPLDQLAERIHEVNRDGVVIFYCQSGMRSISACRILSRHEFRNITYLQGGLQQLSNQSLA